MQPLLIAVLVYTIVFGTDYLFYLRGKQAYQYVSRRTYALFIGGQIAFLIIFYNQYKPFFEHIWAEVFLLLLFLLMMLMFSYALSRERVLVCNIVSRTERCLTPRYVMVKGAEIMFQQLAYASIAFSLVPILGSGFWAYIGYILILVTIHTPVVLSMKVPTQQILTFGILILAAPIFYIYTEVGYLWPAVYVHAIIYVFFWLANADWEQYSAIPIKNPVPRATYRQETEFKSKIVKKSG